MRTVVALFCVAGVVLGCGPSATVAPMSSELPTHDLALPESAYGTAAWLDDGTVVLEWTPPPAPPGEPDTPENTNRLVTIELDSTAHRELPRSPDEPCSSFSDDRAPSRLPDGSLGLIRSCRGDPDDYEILRLDLETSEFSVVAALGVPLVRSAHYVLGDYSFRPDMKWGLVSLGDLCAGVARFDAGGIRPLALTVESAGERIHLDDFFVRDCTETENVDHGEWSPDGKHISLLVSVGLRSKDGFGRIGGAHRLLLVNPDSGDSVVLLQGIGDALQVAWSPDGKWLVVVEDLGDAADGATLGNTRSWLLNVDPAVPAVQLAISSRTQGVTWSPDGSALLSRVLVNRLDTLDPPEIRLVVIDISTVIGNVT